MFRRLSLALAVLAAVSLGCHTMDFAVREADGSGVERIHERKNFFLWGLTPTRTIEVRGICANGVQSIQEETTFGDGVLGIVTLGIYAPRSTTYFCRSER